MVALEDGICQPSDTVDVGKGIYMYKGARMTDHNMNKGGYGRISAEQAIWVFFEYRCGEDYSERVRKEPD